VQALIVDDEALAREKLKGVVEGATLRYGECLYAASLESARRFIDERAFSLILVDLRIPERDNEVYKTDENGMKLLREIRRHKNSREAACLVVSGAGTPTQTREALKELNIYDFLVKNDYDEEGYKQKIRAALFSAAADRAAKAGETKFELAFIITDTHLTFGEMSGPGRFRDLIPDDPLRFKAADLGSRTDEINLLVSSEIRRRTSNEWRTNARVIGRELYDSLFQNKTFGSLLGAARSSPELASDLRLSFRGTRKSLDVPFELLHDGEEFLASSHPIFRRIATGESAAHKVKAFADWIRELDREDEDLNILLLSSNIGSLTAVDEEVTRIESLLRRKLAAAGVRHHITRVPSEQATYARAVELLKPPYKWHMIHYAGHGRWDDDLPEHSALIFHDDSGRRAIPASVLRDMLKKMPTQLCYLNCCLGARSADRVGRGDFYGLMDSVVQADVPIVLAHRWSVSDGMARDMAFAFYDDLFDHWSPVDALFSAREAGIRQSPHYRDDPGWLSPVMIAQSAYHRGPN
jgi:CHAT domain-containing protein